MGAVPSPIKLNPPRQTASLAPLTLRPHALNEAGILRQAKLQQQVFDNSDADSLSLLEMELSQLSFRTSRFDQLEIADSTIDDLDFSNSDCPRARLTRVEVRQSKWLGCNAGSASFKDVSFQDCQLSLARFSLARFQDVIFENCQLKEADFSGAHFKRVRFTNCDLSGADLNDIEHTQLDLRSSRLNGFRIKPQHLKGLILDAEQALGLIHLLGICVPEEI